MKSLAPALLLALAACVARPNSNGNDESVQRPIAQAGFPTPAEQAKLSQQQGVTPNSNQASPTPMTDPTLKPAAVDPSKKFVYADLYVSLGDPEGQRSLVPYLLKPEEWMLVKCEMLTPTFKHYRFQRVKTGDKELPAVDIFKSNK